MKMIVGLGNPSEKYANTRHNVGFMVLDALANDVGIRAWRSRDSALIAEWRETEQVLLVKPQTYMNRSGDAVGPLARWYKISEEDIVVIHDDLDLPCGKLRLREKGGTGGHHGVESVLHHVGANFIRVKIGIGRPQPGREVVDYVLTSFTGEERQLLTQATAQAIAAIQCFIHQGIDKAMNEFNKKQGGQPC